MMAYEDDCITFLNTPMDTPLYANMCITTSNRLFKCRLLIPQYFGSHSILCFWRFGLESSSGHAVQLSPLIIKTIRIYWEGGGALTEVGFGAPSGCQATHSFGKNLTPGGGFQKWIVPPVKIVLEDNIQSVQDQLSNFFYRIY